MRTHKDLTVWQKSMDLVEQIYTITDKFPKSQLFGLTSQMQRAAVAIPSNIAEGAKRNHKAEYIQFLGVANGSAAELETQLILARKLFSNNQRIDFEKSFNLVEEVLKMLHSLINSLRK